MIEVDRLGRSALGDYCMKKLTQSRRGKTLGVIGEDVIGRPPTVFREVFQLRVPRTAGVDWRLAIPLREEKVFALIQHVALELEDVLPRPDVRTDGVIGEAGFFVKFACRSVAVGFAFVEAAAGGNPK